MNTRFGYKVALATLAVLETKAIQLEHPHDDEPLCECLMTHGQDPFFVDDPIWRSYIEYTDENGETHEYPANYGTATCNAWDSGLAPDCEDNEADFCEAQWCYVDSACEAEDTTAAQLNSEISFSYLNCGNDSSGNDPEDAVEAMGEEVIDESGVCECVMTHGQNPFFFDEGDVWISYIEVEIDGEVYQYPVDYGTAKCAAWDSGLAPYCENNEAEYCEAHSCYVTSDCSASDVTVSTLFPELSYSYATCGNDSTGASTVAEEEAAEEEAAGEEAAEEEAGEDEAAEEEAGEEEAGEEEAGEGEAAEDDADEAEEGDEADAGEEDTAAEAEATAPAAAAAAGCGAGGCGSNDVDVKISFTVNYVEPEAPAAAEADCDDAEEAGAADEMTAEETPEDEGSLLDMVADAVL